MSALRHHTPGLSPTECRDYLSTLIAQLMYQYSLAVKCDRVEYKLLFSSLFLLLRTDKKA